MGLGGEGRRGAKDDTQVSSLSDLWSGVAIHQDREHRRRSRIQREAEDIRSGLGLCQNP